MLAERLPERLAERLPERLRIVHLTRHPVPSALSHLAHKSYAGSPRDHAYTRLATLAPTDPGAVQTYDAETWDRLTPYEKCLFWWTEVHLAGLELPTRFERILFLRITSENLLTGERQVLDQLLQFIDLPWSDGSLSHVSTVVDRWRHHTDEPLDALEVHCHATTADVARELGYDISHLNVGELAARCRGRAGSGIGPPRSPRRPGPIPPHTPRTVRVIRHDDRIALHHHQ